MLTNSVFLLQFPAEDDSFKADRIVDVSWEVAPFPGAPPITLNGTVEQVYAKLVQMNPNYDDDFKDIDPDLERAVGFDKRADTLMCEGEKTADTKHIKEGIKYLRKVKGSPHLGPWDCGRVSCSYYSGIVWCNDSPNSKTLPSFTNIAEGAQVIIDGCDKKGQVVGYLDHSDHWRVVLVDADC
ncbi:hypothetical protein ASPVEDRAFT_143667 [Aspergillus versicolor CBS 583.65]|uniref:Uncharacterized protein n=1 Tax=Aspergillus versicolor CBS 583.65 TaxID=1036611 RepID=A0A1L9Q381_ASPVE|nr:uncharacterized protein ASPVEDRAFT_143667 [Aspergillus versicolor CBS 583.65]OJJ08162.1 hypothetical protein ASPVEDRAFT_143667 [Aspergillus versicolor CBS 583.65]